MKEETKQEERCFALTSIELFGSSASSGRLEDAEILDVILNSKQPLIEIRDQDGKCQRIYYNGKTEGFEGCSILNIASPFIRNLLFQISENQTSKSLLPPNAGFKVEPSGLGQETAE